MSDENDVPIGGDYLWDRSGPADATVTALERSLGTFRFDPAAHPLPLPRRRMRRLPAVLALAAMLALALGGAALWWRLQWPAGQPWRTATTTADGTLREATLSVGQTLDLSNAVEASVRIARLGTARVLGGSEVRLDATSSRRHRLTLWRGTVDVRVWAPPTRFAIETPAGSVIDLGCVFSLTVDEKGVAHLRVETGWVQLENKFGETLVPAGTSSEMSGDTRPVVPVYDDASDSFRGAIRALEFGLSGNKIEFALAEIDRDARVRDVPTLLVLAQRSPAPLRSALLARAALLVPPQAGVSDRANESDAALWEWFDTLRLPPAKAWWLNWRDMFRR